MRLVIFIAQLSRGDTLLQSLCLCRRSILICTTDIQSSAISSSAITAWIARVSVTRLDRMTWHGTHRLKTSALRVLPMMLPRWGTLLQYGNADVISILVSPSFGSLRDRLVRWKFTILNLCLHRCFAWWWDRAQHTLCRVDFGCHRWQITDVSNTAPRWVSILEKCNRDCEIDAV